MQLAILDKVRPRAFPLPKLATGQRHTAANTVPDEECDQVSNVHSSSHSCLHSLDSSCAEIIHNILILMNNSKNTKSALRLGKLHSSLHSSGKHTDSGIALYDSLSST